MLNTEEVKTIRSARPQEMAFAAYCSLVAELLRQQFSSYHLKSVCSAAAIKVLLCASHVYICLGYEWIVSE